MIPNHLSMAWTALAPALGNHLWQSTLFAIAAGLLTLILRKNQARARYWLWLAGSVKFLIPFALLIFLGSHLAWPRGSAGTNAGLYFAMEEVSQPFTQPTVSVISESTASTGLIHLLPAILAAVWLCGFLAVLFVWYRRWRRISAAIREAEPLREGREVETLRRLERIGGRRKRIEMFLSPASLEPGIFGIARPVLVWPEGISERLEDAHLEAILAHELWHVRRRDNLAAALHMLVEAIFWFHPLVWWLGARLMEERERACDEAVLESGSEPQVYAESILKICEFCVGSPLACVAGVTGADLKKRIAHIMTERVTRKLDFSRKLLLSAAGLLAVAAPVVFGLVNAPQGRSQSPKTSDAPLPFFEVAAVKLNRSGDNRFSISLQDPGRFTAINVTTKTLIEFAYNVRDFQLSGGPGWINSERYDIDAKIKDSLVDEERNLTFFQRQDLIRPMLQSLLADRLGLKVTHETKELSVYALVVAKNGPKLSQTSLTPSGSPTASQRASTLQPTGMAVFTLIGPVSAFADALSRLPELGRVVLDQTGLKGNYDFLLQWTPADSTELPTGGDGRGPANARPSDSSGPSIFAAIQEQLGLKLESKKGTVQVLVIDHVEKPSESQAQNTVGAASLAAAPHAPTLDWQAEAGGKQAFVVASVKENQSGSESSSMNVPIGPGDVYPPNGGLLSATNVPLISYIYFAYKLTGSQFQLLIPNLPRWILKDKFDIEARADGNPTKDQMRVMMQSLLADRFKLAIHYETQQLPVFALVLAKPGKTGPQLQPHPDDSSCSTAPPPTSPVSAQEPPATVAGGLPAACGGIVGMPSSPSGRMRIGARNVPIRLLANSLAQVGNLDRPVLDQSGLSGTFDFTFEWSPQHNHPLPSGVNAPLGEPGPTFLEDLKAQLGLTLESQKGPVEVFVIDHVERPSEN